MLEWAHMILENRYTYTFFIDNIPIYSDWVARNILFSMGALQNIIEKHCTTWCQWVKMIIRVDKCITFGIKKFSTLSLQFQLLSKLIIN